MVHLRGVESQQKRALSLRRNKFTLHWANHQSTLYNTTQACETGRPRRWVERRSFLNSTGRKCSEMPRDIATASREYIVRTSVAHALKKPSFRLHSTGHRPFQNRWSLTQTGEARINFLPVAGKTKAGNIRMSGRHSGKYGLSQGVTVHGWGCVVLLTSGESLQGQIQKAL